jgi:hypothetical protein
VVAVVPAVAAAPVADGDGKVFLMIIQEKGRLFTNFSVSLQPKFLLFDSS